MMAGIERTRTRRIGSLVAASVVMMALVVLTAGAVLAAPGRNNENAKLCKDWSSLFREDGSTFVDRSDCTSYAAEGGVILTSTTTTTQPPPPLPYEVFVASGSAAGTYPAAGAEFGAAITGSGVTGALVLVSDGVGIPTDGCEALVGFPAGSIALVNRGGCADDLKVANAQAAGAVAVVVVNDAPGDPTTLQGGNASITIPSVMVSQTSGAIIVSGLPSVGIIRPTP